MMNCFYDDPVLLLQCNSHNMNGQIRARTIASMKKLLVPVIRKQSDDSLIMEYDI